MSFFLKIENRTGAVAGVVEQLLSMSEALSSNPSTTKKKKSVFDSYNCCENSNAALHYKT
jgi:hypothetical protein